jgi:shikimate 5-dehydrogenase
MEAYYGQPTVQDLEKVYHYRDLERGTQLVGVTSVGDLQYLNVALFNTAMAHLGQAARCLPLEIGTLAFFQRVLDALKLNFVAIGEKHRGIIRDIATEQEPMAKEAEEVDFLVRQGGKWHGYNLLCRALFAALENTLRAKESDKNPVKGRTALLVGNTGLVSVLARRVKAAGGTPILTGQDEYAGSQLAQALGCPFAALSTIGNTAYDILILGEGATWQTGLEAEHLKAGTTVLDMTALPRRSDFLRTAQARGCDVVSPGQVLIELIIRQAKAFANQDVPREPLVKVLDSLLED